MSTLSNLSCSIPLYFVKENYIFLLIEEWTERQNTSSKYGCRENTKMLRRWRSDL